MKKYVVMAAVFLGITWQAAAQQEYRTEFPDRQNKVLALTITNGEVTVKTHSEDNVLIRIKGERWNDPSTSERAQGLQMISAEGQDNTQVGLYEVKEGGVLSLTQLGRMDREFEVFVPKSASVRLIESGWYGSGDFKVEGVGGEVEIEAKNGDVMLREVTGPLVIDALNGDVDIIFSSVNQSQPMSVNATNGAIDVTFPAAAKGEIHMRALNGEVFTDLNLEVSNRDNGYGTNMTGKLNGGGVKIDLSALNGNIFLRKR